MTSEHHAGVRAFWGPRQNAWLLELETCTSDKRRDQLHESIERADRWLNHDRWLDEKDVKPNGGGNE